MKSILAKTLTVTALGLSGVAHGHLYDVMDLSRYESAKNYDAYINKKVNGYSIDLCYAEMGDYEDIEETSYYSYNLCSTNATKHFDKIIKSGKPNFNKDKILGHISMPSVYNPDFKIYTYVAINPKTKTVETLPWTVGSDNIVPTLKISAKSNKICLLDEDKNFTNGGWRSAASGEEGVCIEYLTPAQQKGAYHKWEISLGNK
ncbi:hypothetical protein ACFBZI_11445 [Moraxella sp. ZJ142]|uniref:hypothetical protein n=1 Tax=Moraxella marmotae TaxID=3344520 RepID=UPI0035D43F3A